MNSFVKIVLLAAILVNFVSCKNESAFVSDNDVATQVVRTNNGDVRGHVLETIRHKTLYYSFKGIPYAKAPTGNLRFKAPVKVDDWSPRVLNATEFGNSCFQTSEFITFLGPQSEDCLFLNVFTPNLKSAEKLPVIFYIHGGGFIEGTGNEYAPDFIVEEDVIVVSINYRVSVFGFLSLGLPEYSGNMGLKDQQLALEWVHENIHHFGGDNKRITIAGHSAGGASAHYHTLSEKSRKLFARAIVMSGTALNRWAHSEKDEDEDIFKMFATAYDLGYMATTAEELVEFLQEVSAKDLMKHTSNSKFIPRADEPKTIYIEWNPIVESKNALNPFLTVDPEEAIKNSAINVTTLFGVTSHEWLCFTTKEFQNSSILENFNEDFWVEFPFNGYKPDLDSDEYRQLAFEVRNYYFGRNVVIDGSSISAYVDMLSDVFFFYHIDKTAKLQANSGESFYFRFSVDAEFNLFKDLRNVTLPGSGHEDDGCYVFRCLILDDKYKEIFDQPTRADNVAYQTIERMTQIWGNFAKHGKPSVEHELEDAMPISENNVHFFDVHNEGIVTALNPNRKAVDFWNQLHEKYQNLFKTHGVIRDEL